MLIEDLTAAVGRYVWLQRALAEWLSAPGASVDGAAGVRAASTADDGPRAAVLVYLHGVARRFDAHSAGWESLLADSPALAAPGQVRAPSPGWDELADAACGDSDRLTALVGVVLPRLSASLERFADGLDGVAEAAEARFCAIVAEDLRDLAARGAALLNQQVPEAAQRRATVTLERRLAGLSC